MNPQKQPLPPPRFDKDLKPRLVAQVLLGINLKANPKHDGEIETAAFSINFVMGVLRTSKKTRQVQLEVRLDPKGEIEKMPYQGSLLVMADVHFDREETDFKLDEIAPWMCVNQLMGAARSYLDMFTALGPFHRVLLPPMTPSQLIGNAYVVKSDGDQPTPLHPDYSQVSDL